MPLVNVVVTLIVVGILLWLINTYIPMDAKIKQLLNIVGETTMLEQTVARISSLIPAERTLVVAGDAYRDPIRACLPQATARSRTTHLGDGRSPHQQERTADSVHEHASRFRTRRLQSHGASH